MPGPHELAENGHAVHAGGAQLLVTGVPVRAEYDCSLFAQGAELRCVAVLEGVLHPVMACGCAGRAGVHAAGPCYGVALPEPEG